MTRLYIVVTRDRDAKADQMGCGFDEAAANTSAARLNKGMRGTGCYAQVVTREVPRFDPAKGE